MRFAVCLDCLEFSEKHIVDDKMMMSDTYMICAGAPLFRLSVECGYEYSGSSLAEATHASNGSSLLLHSKSRTKQPLQASGHADEMVSFS